MTERVCARGCVIRGRHLLVHGSVETCRGCLPADAAEGALLCSRCVHRLRSALNDVPDLCAHLRSMLDPTKSGWNFDREKVSRMSLVDSPAPVNVDLIDAGNEIVSTLAWWASYFGDETAYRLERGFPSSVTPEEAYAVSKWAADYLLINLERICNDSWVVLFSRALLDWPADEREWSVRKALVRFPLEVPSSWSSRPCPGCELRTVRVTHRLGTEYECRACGWVPPADERELWEMYFNEGVAA